MISSFEAYTSGGKFASWSCRTSFCVMDGRAWPCFFPSQQVRTRICTALRLHNMADQFIKDRIVRFGFCVFDNRSPIQAELTSRRDDWGPRRKILRPRERVNQKLPKDLATVHGLQGVPGQLYIFVVGAFYPNAIDNVHYDSGEGSVRMVEGLIYQVNKLMMFNSLAS